MRIFKRRDLLRCSADLWRRNEPDGIEADCRSSGAIQCPNCEVHRRTTAGFTWREKEDLTAMWEALDMPSGYAYGKALRTVKTCVGDTFCRFGTGDSMAVGIELEKRFERLNTPAKVKLAVSGCPRNCAESGIKDLGIVSVDGGWELYAGGNGGVKVRVGELLTTVKTEQDIIEYTEAYLQYYRETGKYGERTSEWVHRLGIEHIRDVVENEEERQQLCARIDQALAVTKDPWKQAIDSKKIQRDLYEVVELT